SGGYYMAKQEIAEILPGASTRALANASLAAFGGIYAELTLKNMVDQELILEQALNFIFN
ncbi:MAG: hypothetical protein ACKN9K_28280, partial [Dolichospermum sp.]